MSITPLSLLKAQLNITDDHDNELLQHKLDAAEAIAGAYIGTPLSAPVPAPITEAALQLAAYWYEQREAVTFGSTGAAVPYGFTELLAPYREAVTGYVPPAPVETEDA